MLVAFYDVLWCYLLSCLSSGRFLAAHFWCYTDFRLPDKSYKFDANILSIFCLRRVGWTMILEPSGDAVLMVKPAQHVRDAFETGKHRFIGGSTPTSRYGRRPPPSHPLCVGEWDTAWALHHFPEIDMHDHRHVDACCRQNREWPARSVPDSTGPACLTVS